MWIMLVAILVIIVEVGVVVLLVVVRVGGHVSERVHACMREREVLRCCRRHTGVAWGGTRWKEDRRGRGDEGGYCFHKYAHGSVEFCLPVRVHAPRYKVPLQLQRERRECVYVRVSVCEREGRK